MASGRESGQPPRPGALGRALRRKLAQHAGARTGARTWARAEHALADLLARLLHPLAGLFARTGATAGLARVSRDVNSSAMLMPMMIEYRTIRKSNVDVI